MHEVSVPHLLIVCKESILSLFLSTLKEMLHGWSISTVFVFIHSFLYLSPYVDTPADACVQWQ